MPGLIIAVYGRVQGVGFRYAAQKEAKKRNVTGFVRNEPDGSVYIEARGEREDLERLLKWCHGGPWLAKVDTVEFLWKENLERSEDFRIV